MDQPSGSGAPQAPSGDAPSSISREEVSEIVNKAIGARNKLFEKQISDQLDKSTKDLRESMRTLTESITANAGSDKGEKKRRGEGEAGDDPALRSLQRQIQELKVENERVAATAAAEKAKGRDNTLRQRLAESLAEYGIKDSPRIKHAIHHLVDGEKRVSYSEDNEDQIVFRDADGVSLDLATGLKSWAKSEDGKYFLPPTGARGSGDGRGGAAPQRNGQQTGDQAAVWNALAEKIFG